MLKVPVEEIKETDNDKNIIINNENGSVSNVSTGNHPNNNFYNADKETITFLLQHIKKLEQEIEELKGQIKISILVFYS